MPAASGAAGPGPGPALRRCAPRGLGLRRQQVARLHGLAVELHGAGAALRRCRSPCACRAGPSASRRQSTSRVAGARRTKCTLPLTSSAARSGLGGHRALARAGDRRPRRPRRDRRDVWRDVGRRRVHAAHPRSDRIRRRPRRWPAAAPRSGSSAGGGPCRRAGRAGPARPWRAPAACRPACWRAMPRAPARGCRAPRGLRCACRRRPAACTRSSAGRPGLQQERRCRAQVQLPAQLDDVVQPVFLGRVADVILWPASSVSRL